MGLISRVVGFTLALGLAAGCACWGAVTALPEPSPLIKRLSANVGLPTAEVRCITQDDQGFLWFATLDGLARYDGIRCQAYRNDPRDPHSLPDNRVLDLAQEAGGDLWIATEGGLERWRHNTEDFEHVWPAPGSPAEADRPNVRGLLVNPDGTLWLAVLGQGLAHFDPRTRTAAYFLPPDLAGSNTVVRTSSLCRGQRGRLWLGDFRSGLREFDPATRQFRTFLRDPANPRSLVDDNVQCLGQGPDGSLWVGTARGLCRFDPEGGFFQTMNIGTRDSITDLTVTRAGHVWAATDGGGVVGFTSPTSGVRHLTSSEFDARTLVSNVARAVFEDREGDLWVGHFPAGVSHWNNGRGQFTVYRRSPGASNTLSAASVLSLLEDPDGTLWVGTDGGGLDKFNPTSGQWTNFRNDPNDPGSLPANPVLSLLRDRAGRLWAGTWNGGLSRMEPGGHSFKRFTARGDSRPMLTAPQVWRMAEDQQGMLWIATLGGGINRFRPDGEGFEVFRENPSNPGALNNDLVWCLCETRDGTFWAGTHGGLARFDARSRTWRPYRHDPARPDSLSDDAVMEINEARDGTLWIGTYAGGLNRFEPRTERFTAYREADGLPSDAVMSVLEEDAGLLWVATTRGLCSFDPRTRQVRVRDEHDGLPDLQFNRGARLRTRDGRFLFGSVDGIAAFHPARLVPLTNQPPVVLTDFEVFNEPQQPGAPESPLAVTLSHTRRLDIPSRWSVISFRFAALSFRAPDRIRYEYRLDGFDQGWRPAGPERRATYTNLDPGHYRFRVRATNGNGVWAENEDPPLLVVLPALWQAPWFRGLVAVGVVTGLLAAGWSVSARRSRSRLLEAERERALALERQAGAEALRQEHAFLRRVIDAVPGFVCVKDARGRFVIANAALAASFGRSVEEVEGRLESELNPNAGEVERFQRDDREVLGTRRMKRVPEESVTFADGARHWLATSKVPLVELDGQCRQVLVIASDVTERKRAEEALQESEVRLAKTSDTAPGMIYQFLLRPDGSTCFPYASSWCRTMFGIEPETLRADARPILDLILAEDRPSFEESVARSARSLDLWRWEGRLRSARGDIVWHHGISRPERLPDGGILWSGIFFDTTARKRAEMESEENRRRLELALRGGRLGIWDWQPETGAVNYSELWAEILGYPLAEVEPTVGFFERHVHPEDKPAVLERLQGHLEGRYPVYESEHRLRTKSGQWIWVLDRGEIAERSTEGRPLRVTGVISDITERKRAEEALRFTQFAVDHTADAAFWLTPDGRFFYVNEAACQALGYTRDELLRMSASDIGPEYPREVWAAHWQELREKGHLVFETTHRAKDGRVFPVEIQANFVEFDGQEYNCAFVRDITERKRVEEALRASQANLSLVFNHTSDMQTLLEVEPDRRLRLVAVNRSYLEEIHRLGLPEVTADFFIGKYRDDMLHEFGFPKEDIDRDGAYFLQAIESGRIVHFEQTVPAPAKTLLIECWVVPVVDASGRCTHLLYTARDITERKRAEEKLRQQTALLQGFMENAPYIIQLFDPQGHSVYANPAFHRTFATLPPPGWSFFEDPQLAAAGLGHYLEQIRRGETVTLPEMWFKPGQSVPGVPDAERCVSEVAFALRDDAGRIQQYALIAQDVTERRRVEEALRESEERYAQVIEATRDGVFDQDLATGRNIVSPRWREIHDLPPDAPVPNLDEWRQLVHPEDLPVVEAAIQAHFAGQTVVAHNEYRLRDREGRYRWVHAQAKALRNAQGQPVRVVGAVTDITERKRAEEALRESEERYRTIFERSPLGIATGTLDGRLLSANPAFCRMLEFSEAELLDRNIADLTVADDFERERAAFEEVRAGRLGDYAAEKRYRARSGGIVWAKLSATVIRDAQGRPQFSIGMVENITQRKQAEQALRESEERLRLALSAANQGFYDLDVQTGAATVSPEYATMLGYDPGSFVETNAAWIERLHPDDHDRTAAIYRDYVAGKLPLYQVEFRQRTADGGWKWILSLGRIVERDAEGRPRRMLGTHTDITERKRAEQAVEESEARYRMLFETNPLPMWVYDLETLAFRAVNAAAIRHYGYTEQEFRAMTIRDIRPAEDVSALLENIAHVTSGLDVAGMWRHRKKDGTIITVEIVSHTLQFEGRACELVLAHDVTERRRAEQALQREREFVRALLETMVDGVVACDAEGRLALFNQTARDWHGLGPEDIAQDQWATAYDLYAEDEITRLTAETVPLARAFRGERLRDTPLVIRPAGRPSRHVMSNCSVFFDAQGNKLGAVAVMRDVTEARRVELALRESEARFRQVVEAAPLPIGISRPDGCIEYINPRFQETFGYSLPEIARLEDWFRLAYPDPAYREDTVRRWQSVIEAAARQHRPSETIEAEIACKDGAARSVQVFGAFMDQRLLVIFNDITERKQAEEALRGSLEEKVALLKEVHHRVKNNLQIVTSLLNLQAGQEKNRAVLDALRDTQNRVRSMALLHEMLYRSDSLARVSLAGYAQSLCAHLMRALGSAGGRVQLECSLPAVELPLDRAVPCGLILNELVSNALKHAFPEDRQGRITVTSAGAGAGQITLTVVDDGVGLPAGLDPASSGSLGLQLVHLLTDQLKGTLTVDTTRGTAFHLSFPAPPPTPG